MTLILPQQDQNNFDFRFRHNVKLFSAGYTDPVVVFNVLSNVNCAVYPDPGSTARWEYTVSTTTEAGDGTAVWFPWPAGDAAANTVDSMFSNASAVRGYTDGAAIFEFSAT